MLWLLAPLAAAQARAITPDTTDGNCQAPTWAPDGTRLAYEVNRHDTRSVSLHIYTPGRPTETIAPRATASGISAGFSTAGREQVVHDAVWSPPALQTFLYTATSASQDYDIYVHGGGPLVNAPGADGGPTWSASGQLIAFTSARTGQGDLYLIDVNDVSAPPRRLTTAPDASELYATFSPKDDSIAYVGHTDSGDQIFLISDVGSPSPEILVSLGRTQTRPRFSPDGEKIAFYSDHTERGRFDLYVMTLEDRALTLIDEGVVLNHRGPTWTPGGRQLVYVLDDDNRLDPVYAAPWDHPDKARPLRTGTVGNRDLDVTTGDDGRLWLAVAAQGTTATNLPRSFHRIFVVPLSQL